MASSSHSLLSSLASHPISSPRRSLTRAAARREIAPPSDPPPPAPLVARRSLAAAFLLAHGLAYRADGSVAAGLLDKYVKRKKLEPLESYVPAVLLTQAQFKDLESSLDGEKPDYEISRSLLRSGPAASLRINIRAVAQYAAEDGKGKVASDAVDQCLKALEDLDSLLLHASRKDPSATIEAMRSKLNVAVVALDSLMKTVPVVILDKGKVIADAYLMPSEDDREDNTKMDRDLKDLEEIL